MPQMDDAAIIRFRSHIDTSGGPDACWPWKINASPKGYGQVTINKWPYRANRIAFFLATGTDPGILLVCHSCDTPRCCNPGHLFLGTNAINQAEKAARGRGAFGERNGQCIYPERRATGDRNGARLHPEKVNRGEKNGSSRLTADEVIEMRRLFEGGARISDIAAQFSHVTSTNVGYIVHRKAWKHISP